MNTTKTGMRSILAAAAAGALVLGSAAGVAVAKPAAKPAAKTGYMQVKMADVHNGYVNVNPAATHRVTKLKANVWDSVKGQAPTSVTFTLTQYDAKGGKPVAAPAIPLGPVTLATTAKVDKKSKNYKGEIDIYAALDALGEPAKSNALAAIAAAPVLVCLDKVEMAVPTIDDPLTTDVETILVKDPKRQVTNKIGRDCVKVVNVAPTVS